jgi:beta-galactosidase/beta-glucuronidase
MSGIFRDVYLWAAPEQHVRDIEVRTELDSSYKDATLKIGAAVANATDKASKVTVVAELRNAAGLPVGKAATTTVEAGAKGEASESPANEISTGLEQANTDDHG